MDPSKNTFKVITLVNDQPEETDRMYYYLSQKTNNFRIFRVIDFKQTVTSFEQDLEEIDPTPENMRVIEAGNIETIYLLNLNSSPKMYSLTY